MGEIPSAKRGFRCVYSPLLRRVRGVLVWGIEGDLTIITESKKILSGSNKTGKTPKFRNGNAAEKIAGGL